MRIVVFTEYGDNYRPIAEVTVPIMREYCHIHRYEFRELILDGTGNEYYYKKHEFIRDLFEDESIDIAFYLDCDAVFTNLKIPLTNFIPYGASFVITEHAGELNGGAILVRNFARKNDVNNFILAHKDKFPNEQNVINHYRQKLIWANEMYISKHPSFNSLDYSQYQEFPNLRDSQDGHWNEGDFILHVPALAIEKRIEVLKNAKITR